jgi:hypothetical protein
LQTRCGPREPHKLRAGLLLDPGDLGVVFLAQGAWRTRDARFAIRLSFSLVARLELRKPLKFVAELRGFEPLTSGGRASAL